MLIKPVLQNGALLADIHNASNGGDRLHLWWLGQSGFLLKCAGEFLLLDPYLSDSLTKKYAKSDKPHVRMTDLCISPEKLDMVGVVTSSHQHTDHFDEETLRPLAKASGGIKLVLPEANLPQARKRLPDSGIEYLAINDGQSLTVNGWEFTGVAAAHNLVDRDSQGRCQYLGFIIRRNGITIYHSGDTKWHDGLIEPLRHARCDLMLLPINGDKPERRVAGNLNGTEAAALAKACDAGLVVPCHYEMFKFNTDTTDEFVAACTRLGQAHHLMRCGSRLTVGGR
ncbi:MBL fold metallo-hydrolase [Roseimicrobium sp. ORNL1]|uniref:MBL fold metallo-hydrolase n=1 Tax=Roseimicrobium sp. ORNL1 TaxID=2711231 RepID=UPI0013E10FCA|nr:MBL fold metallo-hydrolase [Roseimicrobium sp. ORNL1]QIF03787.1 MBL fold metallo-hydrolase [Roseimicrobium sp. ORNL1]